MIKEMKNTIRILIEDENGLHQAILNDTDESKEVVHNINNILKMSDVTDFIFVVDLKNYNGADVSVHGNSEKIARMYDLLTKFLIQMDPHIIMRVISAWDKGMGAAK